MVRTKKSLWTGKPQAEPGLEWTAICFWLIVAYEGKDKTPYVPFSTDGPFSDVQGANSIETNALPYHQACSLLDWVMMTIPMVNPTQLCRYMLPPLNWKWANIFPYTGLIIGCFLSSVVNKMWLQYVRRILNSTLLLRFLFAIKGSGCCDACSTKNWSSGF